MEHTLSRRELLAGLTVATSAQGLSAAENREKRLTLCAFSKHFQWAGVQEAAETCAALGYQGIDLTVRKGGHVSPERVRADLPRAIEAIRKTGLTVPMVTTDIVDANSPHAEAVIQTLSSLGIHRYRWGGFRYNNTDGIPQQLEGFKIRVRGLAALNRRYGVCAMYHTHSGVGQVGASMWDLYLILKDYDREAVAVNYDIGHATVEGGYGGWVHSTRLLLPFMRGVAVKDFLWKQNAKGDWVPGWCGLGRGMVHFKKFFSMINAGGFSGPLQLHMEYPELGGANEGKRQVSIPKDQMLAIMRRDVDVLKGILRETGWA